MTTPERASTRLSKEVVIPPELMERARERPLCIECVMAWLLYGDGAECLLGHGKVYWRDRD